MRGKESWKRIRERIEDKRGDVKVGVRENQTGVRMREGMREEPH